MSRLLSRLGSRTDTLAHDLWGNMWLSPPHDAVYQPLLERPRWNGLLGRLQCPVAGLRLLSIPCRACLFASDWKIMVCRRTQQSCRLMRTRARIALRVVYNRFGLLKRRRMLGWRIDESMSGWRSDPQAMRKPPGMRLISRRMWMNDLSQQEKTNGLREKIAILCLRAPHHDVELNVSE